MPTSLPLVKPALKDIGKGSSKPSFESGGLFRDDVGENAEGWKTEGLLSYESGNQTRLGRPKERETDVN